jgi:hypothetical protein
MKKLAKAQFGKAIQFLNKAVKPIAKTAKPAVKELSEFQKARLASGKSITGLGLAEQKAKRDLSKSISSTAGTKKLTKKEQYQKAIDDMNRKKGGQINTKKSNYGKK